MKDAIVGKLAHALSERIATEQQVVYMLVELRKVLDRRRSERLPDYQNIRLCCDWIVHVSLHGDAAQKLVSEAEEIYAKSTQGTLTDSEKSSFRDRFTLKSLRNELDVLFGELGLPRFREEQWNSFLSCFLGVIEDCPLSLRSAQQSTAKIDEVVLTREVGTILGQADGKPPRIVWELKYKGIHKHWLTANLGD